LKVKGKTDGLPLLSTLSYFCALALTCWHNRKLFSLAPEQELQRLA
jgi:hypothetical protein